MFVSVCMDEHVIHTMFPPPLPGNRRIDATEYEAHFVNLKTKYHI